MRLRLLPASPKPERFFFWQERVFPSEMMGKEPQEAAKDPRGQQEDGPGRSWGDFACWGSSGFAFCRAFFTSLGI